MDTNKIVKVLDTIREMLERDNVLDAQIEIANLQWLLKHPEGELIGDQPVFVTVRDRGVNDAHRPSTSDQKPAGMQPGSRGPHVDRDTEELPFF